MKGNAKISAIYSGICLVLLIFDSKLAFEGAKTGLDLCVKTVIPSLFPFFVLSTIFTGSLSNQNSLRLKHLTRFVGISENAVSVLIPAFLGGYPVGAKAVSDLYHNGSLQKREAEQMLAFCSNAGPSFLFGMISALFPTKDWLWKLWGIQVLGALITAHLFPALSVDHHHDHHQMEELQSDIMRSSLHAMAVVCGWVILFRTLLTVLNKWLLWMFPIWIQVLVTGILELSNGCYELLRISSIPLRFILCCGMLSFGGICVLLQTISVTRGLSLRKYIGGKAIQAVLSMFLGYITVTASSEITVIFGIFLLVFLRLSKNRYSNPKPYPV